jgi:hypothetical protein
MTRRISASWRQPGATRPEFKANTPKGETEDGIGLLCDAIRRIGFRFEPGAIAELLLANSWLDEPDLAPVPLPVTTGGTVDVRFERALSPRGARVDARWSLEGCDVHVYAIADVGAHSDPATLVAAAIDRAIATVVVDLQRPQGPDDIPGLGDWVAESQMTGNFGYGVQTVYVPVLFTWDGPRPEVPA